MIFQFSMGGFEQILIVYVTLPLRNENMKQIFADTLCESPYFRKVALLNMICILLKRKWKEFL